MFIRPYLAQLTRSELFMVMTGGMAGIAGTVLVLYATFMAPLIPDAAAHFVIASVLGAPAAILISLIMVPETSDKRTGGMLTADDTDMQAKSTMDAIVKGTTSGLELLLNIIAMLLVLVALVYLANAILGLLPEIGGAKISLQRLLGYLMAPVCWLMGLPWSQAITAGSLMGTKTVLNELIAYVDLSKLGPDALDPRSRLIMLYAMCGFANFASLGIMIGGLGTMAPGAPRGNQCARAEVDRLGHAGHVPDGRDRGGDELASGNRQKSTRCGILHTQTLRLALRLRLRTTTFEPPERRRPPHLSSPTTANGGAGTMQDTMRLYRTLFGTRAYLRSLCEGAAFLSASSIAIFAAVTYATVHASNHVTDFVLSRVGPYNVRFLFIYGTFTAFVITAGLLAWRPNRLPFALKAMALFLVVRAVFVALTHMAPSPIDPQQPAPFFNSIFYGSDLFFSGHTGMPFLAALAFWHIPPWRIFYLALTRSSARSCCSATTTIRSTCSPHCSSPTASFRRRAGCSAAITRCFVPPRTRPHHGRSGQVARRVPVAEPARATRPFVLHAVGNDPAPSDQSKTGL